jgi:hypothetical protein
MAKIIQFKPPHQNLMPPLLQKISEQSYNLPTDEVTEDELVHERFTNYCKPLAWPQLKVACINYPILRVRFLNSIRNKTA